jgi:hypothetical protein
MNGRLNKSPRKMDNRKIGEREFKYFRLQKGLKVELKVQLSL